MPPWSPFGPSPPAWWPASRSLLRLPLDWQAYRFRLLLPSSSHRGDPLALVTALASSHLTACALWQPIEQDSSRRKTHRGVLKPQLSPRSPVAKEELKIFLMAVWTAELQLCWHFFKFSTCRTSKWTSVPAAEMCLDLAAVGIYMWGLDQARVWATSIAPVADPGAWVLQSWGLNTLDLPWRLGENNIWELPGPTASILTELRWDQEQCQQQVLCEPARWAKGTQQSTFPGEQLQKRNTQWHLSQWECSNPAYLALKIRNTAKKQISN